MKRFATAAVVAGLFCGGARAAAQAIGESTIVGTVTDATGAIIAPAHVTVAGPALIAGDRTTTTDGGGNYRLPHLPAGTYDVIADAPAFAAMRRSAIVLPANTTLTIDFRLELAALTNEVTVKASSPMVDVRSSSAPTIIDEPMLQHLPTNRSVADLINLTPGVVRALAPGKPDNVAFGGTQGSNAVIVDGISTTDPEVGQIRVTPNYNWIEQAQTVALGADAEYGRTTGAILDATLRSGSNRLSALGEYRATAPAWVADNTSNPAFTPRTIAASWDADAQLGGPVRRDRVWFFGGWQFADIEDKPAGFNGPFTTLAHDGGALAKIDAALAPGLLLDTVVQLDRHTADNVGLSVSIPTPAAAFHQNTSTWAGSGRLQWIRGSRTTAQISARGYQGPSQSGSMLPGGDAGPAPHSDLATGVASVNASSFSNGTRHVASVSVRVTHYADSFIKGSHDLKLGADFERTRTEDWQGYPGGRAYFDYAGAPYEVALWDGNDVRSSGRQTALYAQDAWRVTDAVTINAGLRVDVNRGAVPDAGTVFATTPVSPRIGMAWDVTPNHRTVVKAHYGVYADPLYANLYSFADRRGIHSEIIAKIVAPGQFVQLARDDFFPASIDPDLSQPNVAQAFVGIEHEIARNAMLAARYIDRRFRDFIAGADVGSAWAPTQRRDPGPDGIAGTADDGSLLAAFQLTNPGHRTIVLTNPAEAYRRYDAVQLVATKRYSGMWQLLSSYTWTRNTGTVASGGTYANAYVDRYDLGWTGPFADPNRLVNKDAPFTATELKVEGMWRLARFGGANLSGVFRRMSGAPLRRVARFSGLGLGLEPVIADKSVSQYLDAVQTLDARVEKTFRLQRSSAGVYLDVFNAFNQGVATSAVAAAGRQFGSPLTWTDPRTARAGIRWTF